MNNTLLDLAIARAKVFDDGSDGADAESAQSVVALLEEYRVSTTIDDAMIDRFSQAWFGWVMTHPMDRARLKKALQDAFNG